jgi:hypothetical protein
LASIFLYLPVMVHQVIFDLKIQKMIL